MTYLTNQLRDQHHNEDRKTLKSLKVGDIFKDFFGHYYEVTNVTSKDVEVKPAKKTEGIVSSVYRY